MNGGNKMDISKTKRILAHYDISPARLCSEDEEIQEKEVEKLVNYLKDVQHMTPEEIEKFFTEFKMEFLNLIEDEED